MGETADDTRKEIEQTRRELSATLATLRARTVVVRGRVVRVVVIAGVAAGVAGITVATAIAVRRRRGGHVTRAAKHLPAITQEAVLPAARFTDRWLTARAQAARRQREEIVEQLSMRIADNQAQAQRRANPLWRRAAATALETAASVGVAALVRRAMDERSSRAASADGDTSREERDLIGNTDPKPEFAAAGSH
jgi:hypothetical protein